MHGTSEVDTVHHSHSISINHCRQLDAIYCLVIERDELQSRCYTDDDADADVASMATGRPRCDTRIKPVVKLLHRVDLQRLTTPNWTILVLVDQQNVAL